MTEANSRFKLKKLRKEESIMVLSTQPMPIQAEEATIYLTGLFMYREEPAGDASALAFFREFLRDAADFECCTGSYRMRIAYPDGREIYFGDNAGIMRWYIGPKGFFTTLREAAPDNPSPNESAIAQFLHYGCIYGPETVLHEVRRTDPGKYYLLENGSVQEKGKGLLPLEDLEAPEDALAVQMRRLSRAVSGRGDIACTITGGIDSRTILAHMIHCGLHPLLDITGKPTDIDVVIAQKVAEHLDEKLLFIQESPEEENWLEDVIREADGMAGVCGLYRLYKKARQLPEEGILLECGGLNGEMYKNSFINQDYPFYGGNPRWEHFLRFKVLTSDFPVQICGSRFAAVMKETPAATLDWLRSHTGKTKASAYLSAGYEIMQGRAAAGGAMNARYYIPYAPFMERAVAAPMFKENPYSLEMQAFQRKQVTTFCPEIKDIETDRGLTCASGKMASEWLKSTVFLVHVAMGRIFRRGKVKGRIDTCFEEGLSSPQYRAALERCKELGIIAPEVSNLPMAIADRVFALGTIL